jgi:hypothetical protein
MRKYKLQDEKIPTAEQQWRCTKYVLLSHFTVELPQVRPPFLTFGIEVLPLTYLALIFDRSGLSTPSASTLAWLPTKSPSLPSPPWPGKSESFSSLRISSTTGLTVAFTGVLSTG